MEIYNNGFYGFLFILFSNFSYSFGTKYRVIGLCDINIYAMCREIFSEQLIQSVPAGIDIQWHMSPGTGIYIENINTINSLTNNSLYEDILVVLGERSLVNAATTVAKTKDIPIFVFVTENPRDIIFPEVAISLQPHMYTLGEAAAKLIRNNRNSKSSIITESVYVQDGFLYGFWNTTVINISKNMVVSDTDSDITLYLKLQDLLERGIKVLLVHTSPTLMLRLLHICEMNFIQSTFSWILSDISTSGSDDLYVDLPKYLIAIKADEIDGLDNLLRRTRISIVKGLSNMDRYVGYKAVDVEYTTSQFRNSFYRSILSQKYSPNTPSLSFDVSGMTVTRTNTTFKLLTWECSHGERTNCWTDIGYLLDRNSNVDIVMWPWNSLFGNLEGQRTVYRVITRPAPPFVFTKGPVDSTDSCYGDTPCLQILSGDANYLHFSLDEMRTYNKNYVSFEYFCCSGIVIDILESLATDLDFDFLLYFLKEDSYSNNSSDVYDSLIQSIVSGSADILAGAVSINSHRAQQIHFTEPYYFSGFAMIVPVKGFVPSMDAFTAPFDAQVWATIFLSATIVAIATSLLEWNSPFGLNPWGRKRSKNYTLGSSLVMVYSVLFGHTVSTKSPKSWPGKVLQNFWAGLAIFIVASYTANLAAYLAGNTEVENIGTILDSSIRGKRLFARLGSASVQYIDILNKNLYKNIEVNEISANVTVTDIVSSLRDNRYDVFIDDRPIIEYGLTQHDNCTIKFAGKDFGEILYAFGISKYSTALRDNLSSLILNYVEGGFVYDISLKYIKRRECEGKKEKYNQRYGLEHTGGLFIMLLCAFAISGILLFFEHCVFKYLVPFLREKPQNSIWKKRNVEFFNQRLYRTIMSETLVSPQQTAREMMKLMKDRQFARLFQKNELKEHKIPKRDAMKGLRFMNLTDSLIRTYRTQNSVPDSIFSTKSSANLYSIAESESEEHPHVTFDFGDDDCFELVDEEAIETENECKSKRTKVTRGPRRCNTFNYPRNNMSYKRLSLFELDSNITKDVTKNRLWTRKNSETGVLDSSCSNRYRTASDPQLNGRCSKHEKWPNIQDSVVRKELVLPSDKDANHKEIEQIEMHDISRENSPHNSDRNVPNSENLPSIEQETLVSGAEKIVPSGRKDSSYYGRSLKMKDNRVKSTLRRHAMTKFRRHSSSTLDEFAVDALSKEDLLILWKKSEIELQTKLNKLSYQNAHLKKMLRIAEDTGQVNRDDCTLAMSSDLLPTRI